MSGTKELTRTSGWTLEVDAAGIGVLWIDTPGQRINILTQGMFEGLHQEMEALRQRSDVVALVLASRKPAFLAGADIDMFAHIHTCEAAEQASLQGQAVLGEVAALSIPTVAAISGACMGGGLELALCCTDRIASDDPSTVLSLPEVQIGLLPGAGGTQRLPRLVGLRAALDMILTSKKVRPHQARKMGLVSEVVPTSMLVDRARALAGELASRPRSATPSKPLTGLLLEATIPGRAMVYQKAEEKVLSTTKGHYPAPLLALEAVRRGYRKPLAEGLAIEAQLFGELLVSPQSRNLIHLFKATTALKSEPVLGADGSPVRGRKVRKIAVLGGGLMGSGIATVAVDNGYRVRIKDQDYAALGRSLAYIRKFADDRARKRRQRPQEVAMLMARATVTTDFSGFKNADLVIEAVFEDLALKQKVLKEVEAVVGPDTVFASNTSSLSISAIAEHAARPHNVVGMHFFSPVEKMPLLEVIAPDGASPEAVATVVEVGRKMGKQVIVVRNKVGFYTSRVLSPYMLEASWLLDAGVPITQIDQALVDFGFPLGPLALMDEVGIDVGGKVVHILHQAFGARFTPPAGMERLMASGRLGKKNRSGFYLYPPEGTKKTSSKREVDPTIRELLPTPVPGLLDQAEIQRRCTLALLNEAVRCLEEGVLTCPRDGDVGAVFGIGFPPFRGGPFRYIDHLTVATVVGQLQRLEKQVGERFRPADRLLEMATRNETFY